MEMFQNYREPGYRVSVDYFLDGGGLGNCAQLNAKYPLALIDAKVTYPNMKVSDNDWVNSAIGFSLTLIGGFAFTKLFNYNPTLFLYSIYACWAYDQTVKKVVDIDELRTIQFTTYCSTLAGTGHTLDSFKLVLDEIPMPDSSYQFLLKLYADVVCDDITVVPYSSGHLGLSVH